MTSCTRQNVSKYLSIPLCKQPFVARRTCSFYFPGVSREAVFLLDLFTRERSTENWFVHTTLLLYGCLYFYRILLTVDGFIKYVSLTRQPACKFTEAETTKDSTKRRRKIVKLFNVKVAWNRETMDDDGFQVLNAFSYVVTGCCIIKLYVVCAWAHRMHALILIVIANTTLRLFTTIKAHYLVNLNIDTHNKHKSKSSLFYSTKLIQSIDMLFHVFIH